MKKKLFLYILALLLVISNIFLYVNYRNQKEYINQLESAAKADTSNFLMEVRYVTVQMDAAFEYNKDMSHEIDYWAKQYFSSVIHDIDILYNDYYLLLLNRYLNETDSSRQLELETCILSANYEIRELIDWVRAYVEFHEKNPLLYHDPYFDEHGVPVPQEFYSFHDLFEPDSEVSRIIREKCESIKALIN